MFNAFNNVVFPTPVFPHIPIFSPLFIFKFTFFNILGGVAWVTVFALLGYFFGNVPFVQQHFSLIVIGIILVSVMPAVIGLIKAFINSRKKKQQEKKD